MEIDIDINETNEKPMKMKKVNKSRAEQSRDNAYTDRISKVSRAGPRRRRRRGRHRTKRKRARKEDGCPGCEL